MANKKNDIETFEPIHSQEFNSLLTDSEAIIEQALGTAYRMVNILLVKRNWLLGKRIAEEELKGESRAEYGKRVIPSLAERLTAKYGQGFDRTNLYYYLDFAKVYPALFEVDNQTKRIVHTTCGESEVEIIHTLCEQSDIYSLLVSETPIQMSWSHYRTLLQVNSDDARLWYEREAVNQAWSVRALQRNIASQYYFRLLQSPAKDKVEAEMKAITAPLQDKLEYMKNPVVAEFLGFHNNTVFSESDLEQSILNHLTTFLMELGKGFAFVDRQKHIHTEKKDYYIDLVFYNYILKCFVLIDLKTNTVDYQDAGQMDMYVKMYDEKYRSENDNPTIGILLCADTDADVAKYSCLHNNDQLYMAKYLTYMPTQEELRREIEQQKMIFALKNGKEKA